MGKTSRNIIVLTLTGIISAACLSLVYREVEPRVAEHREKEQARAVLSVLPGTETFIEEEIEGVVYFAGLDREDNLVGYAIPGKGVGYGGEIRLMVGLDASFKEITGLRILEDIETPGLGGRISEPSFLERFTGLDPRQEIRAVRSPREDAPEVESITSATISSQAVAEIINKTLAGFLEAKRR